jgi:hypothetical protein
MFTKLIVEVVSINEMSGFQGLQMKRIKKIV